MHLRKNEFSALLPTPSPPKASGGDQNNFADSGKKNRFLSPLTRSGGWEMIRLLPVKMTEFNIFLVKINFHRHYFYGGVPFSTLF